MPPPWLVGECRLCLLELPSLRRMGRESRGESKGKGSSCYVDDEDALRGLRFRFVECWWFVFCEGALIARRFRLRQGHVEAVVSSGFLSWDVDDNKLSHELSPLFVVLLHPAGERTKASLCSLGILFA